MWRNCPISPEGSFVLWGGSVTNILYLYGTVCSETFELLKVHGQGLKLWIFFWQIGYRRLGYLLFYEMMICDQEGRIEVRSSLYPDALCNVVHKENVVCSLACPV